jgi:hypothetical protein
MTVPQSYFSLEKSTLIITFSDILNHSQTYEGRLKSSRIYLINPNRNFVEMRWGSLFRSSSFGKRCTSYNAPPTSRKRAAVHWLLRNFLPWSSLFMVRKAQKSQGAISELNSGFVLEKADRWNPTRTSAIQSRSRPMRFLGFSNHEKGARKQEISKWSTVCSTFSRSGWSVVRNTSLAKGGTSEKRPLSHLYKVPTLSNKVCPRTFQTDLVFLKLIRFWKEKEHRIVQGVIQGVTGADNNLFNNTISSL